MEQVEPYDSYLASRIGAESLNPYAVAAELGLPVPTYRKFDSIQTFLDQPEEGLQQLLDVGVTFFT